MSQQQKQVIGFMALVILLVGGLVLVWRFLPPSTSTPPSVPMPSTSTDPIGQPPATSTVVDPPTPPQGMVCDESTSICVSQTYANQLIGNPLTVTGTAVAFEGTVSWRLMQGSDERVIMSGFTTAQQPTVGQPGLFEIRAFFPATYVPTSSDAILMLFEESALDGRPIHVLRLPIKLSSQTTAVTIHALDGDGTDCSMTRRVRVDIPKTSLPIEASIRRLLDLRPTEQHPEWRTSIPQGTKLLSVTLTNGVLKLVFSRELENYGGGSCNVASIRAQIEKTATEFSTVRRVEISVEGKTPEESLQP